MGCRSDGEEVDRERPMATLDQSQKQASRQGRSAITFFVRPKAKALLTAVLAEQGYGTTFQAGLVNLLNELLEKNGREPCC